MTKLRPTAEQCRILRQCAINLCKGQKNVVLELARRADNNDRLTNQLLLSDDHSLDDFVSFTNFRKGTDPLTDDGRGLYDFYVSLKYGSHHHGTYEQELEDNIQAHYEGGKLVKVTGSQQDIWTLEGGFQPIKHITFADVL